MDPAIELHRISKLYGRTVALRSVSLALEAGQTLALLGPNGSGKSTLLRIIAGATSPTIGEGSILGHDLRKERLTLRGQVAMLAADSYLYDDLTAKENLRFIATMAGRKPSSREIMVLLDRVGLAETAHARARTFSSGMKRRLGLARLMLLQPRIVLLDEPYNNLDSPGVELVDQL
ncbi:MAG: ABC transporter ATP-binding protein, partial [Chloroflexota bacterium]